jgi:3-methyladenine DNA glycosylase AlkD
MTADEVLTGLKKLGNESTKKTLLKHGAQEPFFGVKIEDMKKHFVKSIKVNHDLALALYDSGVGDAMYLAGLIADPPKMTKAHLKKWLKTATWPMIAEYTVPWVAAESRFGAELAREWIESKDEKTAAAGWATFASLVNITPDDRLDRAELEKLLGRVQKTIHQSPDRVKYWMNNFVIALGGAVASLTARAKATAKAIGPVEVDMGDTSCRVPDAGASIAKIEKAGRVGKKRAMARC